MNKAAPVPPQISAVHGAIPSRQEGGSQQGYTSPLLNASSQGMER